MINNRSAGCFGDDRKKRRQEQLMTYDPNEKPNAEEWLAIDDSERIALVAEYHKRNKLKAMNKKMHASIQAIVENQIAEGIPQVTETLARLMAEGLGRHEALHAIGDVLADYILRLTRGKIPAENSSEVYFQEIVTLTTKASEES
jgi:hypothetical protein